MPGKVLVYICGSSIIINNIPFHSERGLIWPVSGLVTYILICLAVAGLNKMSLSLVHNPGVGIVLTSYKAATAVQKGYVIFSRARHWRVTELGSH